MLAEHEVPSNTEPLAGLDEFHAGYMEDFNVYAQTCIDKFFEGKEMHCGGRIPKKLLSSKNNVITIINSTVSEAAQVALKSLKAQGEIECSSDNDGVVTEDIKLILAIQKHARKCNVPKEFSGGLLLLYLEICRGVELLQLDLLDF